MADISGGVNVLSACGTFTCTRSCASHSISYGTSRRSEVTSEHLRPMKRLIEKSVFRGFVTACRFATWPTSRSLSLV
jgi:hypothetical protein